MQISFTIDEVFLQLKQDGGRTTSPACPVCHCHFNASCFFLFLFLFFVFLFFFSQGTQGSENILCLYKCYSRILNIKVFIILGNLLQETKRFISRTEEAKIGVGRIRKSLFQVLQRTLRSMRLIIQ